MADKNIHANHRQRMRTRYKSQGLDGFHDHEVLEMLLYYCYPRCDTNEIAHKMLGEFKSLQHLFDANVDTIMARLGCTENIAVLLNLMPAIAKRYLRSKWDEKTALNNANIAGEYAINLFVGDHVETFYALCLDTGLRLHQAVQIAKGTVDEVPVFTRELVKKVLEHHAANVILVHNHPGGITTPSHSDNALTTRVRDALKLIDVPVTDHIIVSGDKYFSYAQRSGNHVDGY
ncbi:MAG: DNA repair protein RadC [Defluviitaleaceae bacterium]|nr:DNA repair protein RadC [Defluviitaleaceae bacterium]